MVGHGIWPNLVVHLVLKVRDNPFRKGMDPPTGNPRNVVGIYWEHKDPGRYMGGCQNDGPFSVPS